MNKKKQYNIAVYDPLVISLCDALRSRGCLGRTIERLLYDNYIEIVEKEKNIIDVMKKRG